ncbi:MAG TPA: DUF4936 family protein [Burkholderiales bacterium]
MTNYYVYYRVDADRVSVLRFQVEKLFQKIQEQTGVRGRWMRRRDDPATYMEVYEGVADDAAFETLLARETAGFGLERRVERFVCV